mgnify:CR=1 FL=1
MNLPRLRELVAMGKDGSIRPEELKELFGALPEVIERFEKLEIAKARRAVPNAGCVHDILVVLRRRQGLDGLIVSELFGSVKGNGSLGYARFRGSLNKAVAEGCVIRRKVGNYWRYRTIDT